jgi:hypothetical protein
MLLVSESQQKSTLRKIKAKSTIGGSLKKKTSIDEVSTTEKSIKIELKFSVKQK